MGDTRSREDSIAALVRGFEDTTLDKGEWTHASHLTVALYYLRHHARDEATRLMRDGIKRFNAAKGGDPSAYHETITLAWLEVVATFLAEHDPEPRVAELGALVDALLRECKDKRYLLNYYSRDLLMSDAARAQWVPPDLAPITCALRRGA